MRILHVVTLVASDASFGGPAQVALAQVAALRDQGNDVLLIGGGKGYSPQTKSVDGAPVRLFRTMQLIRGAGFAGMSSLPMLVWLGLNVRRFDVVHLHLARDLVMIPSALLVLLSGKPFVAQPHGMIVPTDRRLGRILDSLATRRALRAAKKVFVLNETEGTELAQVAGISTTVLINGLPTRDLHPRTVHRQEVLFLARLHERKQPRTFVKMAIELAPSFPDVVFTLVGPDGGELGHVRDLIVDAGLGSRIRIEDPVSPFKVRERMQSAAVYVLPALDEPFGLTVLEALSVGVPVVISKTGGLASAIVSNSVGFTAEDSVESFSACVAALLSDDSVRSEMGARGPRLVKDEFSIEHVRDRLNASYEQIVLQRKHPEGRASV
jgi:glycosyltransferase involved in cell wall biosynthesis